MLGSNFALLVKSPGDDGQQLLTTGSSYVYHWYEQFEMCVFPLVYKVNVSVEEKHASVTNTVLH